jgi:hypothetical protein
MKELYQGFLARDDSGLVTRGACLSSRQVSTELYWSIKACSDSEGLVMSSDEATSLRNDAMSILLR